MAEGVADEEASDTPGLVHRSVLDRQPGGEHTCMHLGQIVDLDRQVGHRRARATLGRNADLRCSRTLGRIGHEPTMVHDQAQAEPDKLLGRYAQILYDYRYVKSTVSFHQYTSGYLPARSYITKPVPRALPRTKLP